MPTPTDPSLPFRVVQADLPEGVALVVSPIAPDEIREGESVAEALVRLNRAVTIREFRTAGAEQQAREEP